MKALLGTKLGMTQLFDESGNVVRVTLIQAGPCVVTQVKTREQDGYNAVQLGFGEAKHQPKPQAGHQKAAGSNARKMREVRIKDVQAGHPDVKTLEATAAEAMALEVGATLDVDALPAGPVLATCDIALRRSYAAAGGDDYELCFTAAPEQRAAILAAGAASGTPVTRVGRIDASPGLQLTDGRGAPLELWLAGFDHFGNQ